jgi:hypothetical protein
MLEGRKTPSCVAAILFGVAFAGEGVRRRCFGFLAWRVCLAGNSSSLAAISLFFSPLRLEVLVGLYRQGTEQGDASPPLLCIHEKKHRLLLAHANKL